MCGPSLYVERTLLDRWRTCPERLRTLTWDLEAHGDVQTFGHMGKLQHTLLQLQCGAMHVLGHSAEDMTCKSCKGAYSPT